MKPPKKKSLPWLRVLFGALLFLITLFIAEEHVRGRIALHRYIKQMSGRGEKFAIAELTPAPVPLDRNGAGLMMSVSFPESALLSVRTPASLRFVTNGVAIPAASFRAWLVSGQSALLLTTNIAGFNIETNVLSSSGSTNVLGYPGSRGRGGRGVTAPQTTWKVVTAGDVAAELAPYSNSLAKVRAALAYPQLDHGVAYEKGFNVLLPHLAREKKAAQWLRASSFSALQETNLDASLNNLLALVAFSHATTNEPMLISQLVRIAISQITIAAIWEALQVEGWNEEQLAKLQAALAPEDFVSSMAQACEMERAMGVMAIDRWSPKEFLGSGVDLQWSAPSFPPASAEESWAPLKELVNNIRPGFIRYVYLPVWRVAWKDQDKLNLMKHWQKQIDLARQQIKQPDWAMRQSPASTSYGEWYDDEHSHGALRSFYDRIRFLCSSLLAGAQGRAFHRAVEIEATQRLARTVVAVRRYYLAQGKNPESLDELVPRFFTVVPPDPFDGKPLRYRRNVDDSFTLYSVGENGKDEGGNATVEKANTNPSLVKGRDIVWPRAATGKESQEFVAGYLERSSGTPGRATPR